MRAAGTKTVLSVAYPFAAVGPDAVGGAEQVLATVEAGLVERGYRSVVAAHAESSVEGTLVSVDVPRGTLTDAVRAEVERRMQAAIDCAFLTERIDLVHAHGIDFAKYRFPVDVPMLATLHLPPDWYPAAVWEMPAHVRLQCVSESQRGACPAAVRERVTVVENGVPLPEAVDAPRGRGYALMLTRVCEEKNLHVGLDAARAAGMPVLLAGKVYPYPEHEAYFVREIAPRLGRGARFIGAVGGAVKQRLLARARCLLVPSVAEETSSLVAMEALAAGTPVVALPSGALPEIVDDGRTGFVVRDAVEMATAIERCGGLDRAVCRAEARERFSAEAMVSRYVALYESLMG